MSPRDRLRALASYDSGRDLATDVLAALACSGELDRFLSQLLDDETAAMLVRLHLRQHDRPALWGET